MTETLKTCHDCGAEKPPEAFRPKINYCRPCESRHRMERMNRTPEAKMAAIEAYRRYRARGGGNRHGGESDYQKYRVKKLLRAKTKRLVAAGIIPNSNGMRTVWGAKSTRPPSPLRCA